MTSRQLRMNKTVAWLQNNPVLYKGKHVQIVNFGLFSALNAMAIMMVFLYYLNLKGMKITPLMLSMLPLSAVMVWVGARAMHLISLGKKVFQNPKKYIFETGFYLQGGVSGAIAWSLVFAYVTATPLSFVWDGLALGTLLGQFFGRIGCFNYGCCFGKPTKLRIGAAYENPDSKILRIHPHLKGVPVHPAQLYKASMNLLAFLVLLLLLPLGLVNGVIAIIFMIYHGITRIIFEYFRSDIYFKQKRNMITFKFAVSSIASGGLIALMGPIVDPSFYDRVELGSTLSLLHFTGWLVENPSIFFTILSMGLITFIGYGIHGKTLGRFPIIERGQQHANENLDHRSRTVWNKSRL